MVSDFARQTQQAIRMLIVDGSPLFRLQFERALAADPEIMVVGTAVTAIDAFYKAERLKPDVVALDADILQNSDVGFLRDLLRKSPLSVLALSSYPDKARDMLETGVHAFMVKPLSHSTQELALFFTSVRSRIKAAHKENPRSNSRAADASASGRNAARDRFVIAIGASTGGTEAILQVVKDLPPTTPGIVIVQHMPAVFTRLYAERLDRSCHMSAKEAEDGDRLETGTILVGAGDYHLTLRRDPQGYFVRSQKGERVSGHCPSVDVLFQSCAKEAGANCIGIILTGMGADGAMGITQLHQTGAFTVGQDKDSCVVYGMPMEANKLGGISRELPLSQIGQEIQAWLTRKNTARV